MHPLIKQFHFLPGDKTHTFTTIGRCPRTGRMGISVSTGELAVGGIHSRRDKWPSIAYPEELNFTISATLQSTDRRHGIVGQERYHFQLNS